MKIHFFGSLRGNKLKTGDKTNYERIIETIEELGHHIITTHSVTKKLGDVLLESIEQHKEYIDRMRNWIKEADVVVVEATEPEIGTGYELALAVDYGKPVIALYTNGQYSPILAGQETDQIQHLEYNVDNLKKILKRALEDAKDQMDVRFTILLPPKIISFLSSISKQERIPRSVYIRKLIEEDIQSRNK